MSAIAGREASGGGRPEDATLGIVVVHFGDPAPTLRCLDAASRQLVAGDRLIVVDNTVSSELSRHPLDPRIERLDCPDNPGYGTGANRGVEALARTARASAWIVLNHDVELLPGFLECARGLLAPPWGAASGPQYLDAQKQRLWFAGGSVVPWLGTVRQSRDPEDARRPREVSFLPGACMVVLDEAWQQTGGFDPRFFLYHEDLDFCLRLRERGWRLRFEPALECLHDLGASTESEARSPFYLEQMARTRLLPWPSLLHRIWLAGLHTLLVTGRSLSLLLSRRPDRARALRSLLRGHLAALSDLHSRGAARRSFEKGTRRH